MYVCGSVGLSVLALLVTVDSLTSWPVAHRVCVQDKKFYSHILKLIRVDYDISTIKVYRLAMYTHRENNCNCNWALRESVSLSSVST